ncbi:MAG: acyltransferase family protein [Oscillospiraceae bacterium]|jgi:peptidoglycan/LPS O-acetylase OafA/YrhL|nr:acyltransferase family protein [Oscillospiraceae bacterium]
MGTSITRKNGAIEFWRYAFAVFAALYHFEKVYEMMPWMASVRRVASVGFIGVEFFFILAGFLIAETDKRRVLAGAPERMSFADAGREAWDYARSRIKTVYPTLAAVLIIFSLILRSGGLAERLRDFMNLEWEALILGGTSFAWGDPESPALFLIVSWFLTDLIISGFFITLFIRMRRDVMRVIAPFAAILLYSLFGHKSFDLYLGHELYGFLSGGMVRSLAGMFLGLTANILYTKLAAANLGAVKRALLSLVEIYAIYRLFSLGWNQEIGVDNYRILVYIPVIIIFAFTSKTAVSRILDNPVSRLLGGVSLAVYLFHWRFLETFFTLKMKLWASVDGLMTLSKLLRQPYSQIQKLVNTPACDLVMYIVAVTICSIALTYALKLSARGIRALRGAAARGTPPEVANGAGEDVTAGEDGGERQ